MRPPRFRLRTLMIVVAIVAVELWSYRLAIYYGPLDWLTAAAIWICINIYVFGLLALIALLFLGRIKSPRRPPGGPT